MSGEGHAITWNSLRSACRRTFSVSGGVCGLKTASTILS